MQCQENTKSFCHMPKRMELADQIVAKSVTGTLCRIQTGSSAFGLINEIQFDNSTSLSFDTQKQINSKPLYFYHQELRKNDLNNGVKTGTLKTGIQVSFDICHIRINSRFVAKNVWLTSDSEEKLETEKKAEKQKKDMGSRIKNTEIGHFLNYTRSKFSTDNVCPKPVLLESNAFGKICDISYESRYGHIMYNTERVFFSENSLIGETTKGLKTGVRVEFDLLSKIKTDRNGIAKILTFAESVKKIADDVELVFEPESEPYLKFGKRIRSASENSNGMLCIPRELEQMRKSISVVENKHEPELRRPSANFLKVDDAAIRTSRRSRRCSTNERL